MDRTGKAAESEAEEVTIKAGAALEGMRNGAAVIKAGKAFTTTARPWAKDDDYVVVRIEKLRYLVHISDLVYGTGTPAA